MTAHSQHWLDSVTQILRFPEEMHTVRGLGYLKKQPSGCTARNFLGTGYITLWSEPACVEQQRRQACSLVLAPHLQEIGTQAGLLFMFPSDNLSAFLQPFDWQCVTAI